MTPFPYMAQIEGIWHMCRPIGRTRPTEGPIETECGIIAGRPATVNFHEAPASYRAGSEETRCKVCSI